MDLLARMLEATVITLREGIEAALIVGIVLAYLRRSGRAQLARFVYWGLGAAVAASVAGAVAVQRFGLDPENEIWEGSLMLVAALLVGSLVIWMWRAGRRIKQETEKQLDKLVGVSGSGGVGLASFVFLMVFREGIETALFLGALSGSIGANPLYNALGGSLGLLLAVLFGFLLIQGSLRINLSQFFAVTGLVLLLMVARLIANGLHEFFEAGLLQPGEAVMAVVGSLTRESTSLILLVLLIALPAGILLMEALKKKAVSSLPGETAAELRKRRAELRSSRLWTGTAGVAGLVLGLLLILSAVATARGYNPSPTPLQLSGPILAIPLSELREQPMKKYTVSLDEVTIRFFIVKGEGDQVAMAFDACEICPLKGYHLIGHQLICKNCGAPISFDTIGIKGGCNPIPLKGAIKGQEILIRAEDLAQGKARFAPSL